MNHLSTGLSTMDGVKETAKTKPTRVRLCSVRRSELIAIVRMLILFSTISSSLSAMTQTTFQGQCSHIPLLTRLPSSPLSMRGNWYPSPLLPRWRHAPLAHRRSTSLSLPHDNPICAAPAAARSCSCRRGPASGSTTPPTGGGRGYGAYNGRHQRRGSGHFSPEEQLAKPAISPFCTFFLLTLPLKGRAVSLVRFPEILIDPSRENKLATRVGGWGD